MHGLGSLVGNSMCGVTVSTVQTTLLSLIISLIMSEIITHYVAVNFCIV